MNRRPKNFFITLAAGAAALAVGTALYLQQPKFGSLPTGAHLEKIKKSPNYVDGQFVNLVPTPQFREGMTIFSATSGFLFNKKVRSAPTRPVPSSKTPLAAMDKEQDTVIWLGHSSYYMQIGGRNVLVDPVLSASAAPLEFLNKAFAGTDLYQAEDFPEIDYLLITHDHWDHLDYPTVMALKEKIKTIICPLGVGGYFAQ